MKKEILFVLALLMAVTGYAQEVITVRLKNGTEMRFSNGIAANTINFFGTDREGEELTSIPAAYGDKGWNVEGLQVADMAHQGGEYAVAIAWKNIEYEVPVRTGICIGTEPGVTVEHCDSSFFDENVDDNYWTGTLTDNIQGWGYSYPYHVLLGDSLTFFRGSNGSGKTQWIGIGVQSRNERYTYNWCNYALERGKTYYYRVFACVPYYTDTDTPGTTYYYGPEQSFRIPNLKEDAGYTDGDTYFSKEAWEAFLGHFPDDMTVARRNMLVGHSLPALQRKWEATFDESPYDLTTATDLTFDDGIVHILPAVPEAFWEWISTREIVIGAEDAENYAGDLISVNNEYLPGTSFEVVSNVDAAWGIPHNSYIACNPMTYESISNMNTYVYFNLTEAMPGVDYKLSVTFAPETRFTSDEDGNYSDEESVHFLPAPLQMYMGVPTESGQATYGTTPWGYFPPSARIINNPSPDTDAGENSRTFVALGTKTKIVELEGLDVATSVLRIGSSARASQLNRTQTNELRIAEVRLTPILPTE